VKWKVEGHAFSLFPCVPWRLGWLAWSP
jgi:hypothetical protein